MGHSRVVSEGECGPLGRGRSVLSSSSGGGDIDSAGEEESESSVDLSSRNQERNLRQRLVLRKHFEETKARVEWLQSVDCFGWGPGITE